MFFSVLHQYSYPDDYNFNTITLAKKNHSFNETSQKTLCLNYWSFILSTTTQTFCRNPTGLQTGTQLSPRLDPIVYLPIIVLAYTNEVIALAVCCKDRFQSCSNSFLHKNFLDCSKIVAEARRVIKLYLHMLFSACQA